MDVCASRLVVAVVRGGRVVDRRVRWFPAADWSVPWPGPLGPRGGALANMVDELGLRGREAVITYQAPTAVAGVFGCPINAGPAGAARAGELALSELVGQPLTGQPHGLETLWTDGEDAGAEPGTPAQRHTLGVFDKRTSAEAVCAWAAAAGLRPLVLAPAEAASMRMAVEGAREDSPGATVTVWIGEHASVLAASSGRRLLFVRTLGIGAESLVEALGRPMRVRSDEPREPVSLSPAEARALLYRVGVPMPGDVVDQARGLMGSSVLPVLQPVLQRLAVELKQSIRFGLPEGLRDGASLRLGGSGGLVPGLGEVLAKQIVAPLAVAKDLGLRLAPVGDVPVVLPGVESGESINLVPASFAQRDAAQRGRTGLRIGLVACAALIGFSGLSSWFSLRQERAAYEALTAQDPIMVEAARLQALADQATAAWNGMRTRVAGEVGLAPPIAHVLALIADAMPAEMALRSIELKEPTRLGVKNNAPGSSSTLVLTGEVRETAGTDLAQTIRQFSDALAATPLVNAVRLGTTQRAEQDGRPVSRFELTLSVVNLPASSLASVTETRP